MVTVNITFFSRAHAGPCCGRLSWGKQKPPSILGTERLNVEIAIVTYGEVERPWRCQKHEIETELLFAISLWEVKGNIWDKISIIVSWNKKIVELWWNQRRFRKSPLCNGVWRTFLDGIGEVGNREYRIEYWFNIALCEHGLKTWLPGIGCDCLVLIPKWGF